MRIVVVGGGAIGSSVAMFVRRRLPAATVTVVERDACYTKASSALSASSIRQQFSAPVNIQLSLFGLEYLRQPQVKEAVHFNEGGYLYLASTDEGAKVLETNQALQKSMGADIRYLESPAAIKERFPFINVDDLKAGSIGVTGEGWFDGFSLLCHLRQEAIKEGAIYCKGEVSAMECKDNQVTAVAYKPLCGSSEETKTLECDVVVNAGGPWARSVAALVGLDCPVFARRRVVYVVRSAEAIVCPLVIDPSGLWFRGDSPSQFLAGTPPPEGMDIDDLPLDNTDYDRTHFEEVVWPAMAHRVPAFDTIQMRSWWAGYYEMHPMDHNAIIGPHPTRLRNFLFANGFSGHGIQHSIGVGRAITELIADGAFQSIDLSPLQYDRILRGEPFHEKNVI